MAIGKPIPIGKDSGKGNANYDFSKQNEPKKRMGAKSFANMPEEPMIQSFSSRNEYRSGCINRFDASIEDISGICENRK